MTLVQIGAGNIGRSFVGQLFARAGYEVVFIDVVDEVVAALNERRCYTVEIRDEHPESIQVRNVRAIHGRDMEAAAGALAAADIAATAVGPGALRFIYPTIARALVLRNERGAAPLDIIICENLRGAARAFAEGLKPLLPEGFPLADSVGLVETSIGKMVPIMTEEQRRTDPLLVYAEAYNTLICDACAFRNPIPEVPGLLPKANMRAYVDRKLFVHNLGHALTAYLGHVRAPGAVFVWQAVEDERVGPSVRAGMWESGRALIAEYPAEFSETDMGEHIDDLLRRFRNRALGDTVFRVGRDVQRKLSREDRVIGSLLLDASHGVPAPETTRCAAAALCFRATDEHGQMFPADEEFAGILRERGPEHVLETVCGLRPARSPDRVVMRDVLVEYARLTS